MLLRFGQPREFVALFRTVPSLSMAALMSRKRPETMSGTCWIASCLGGRELVSRAVIVQWFGVLRTKGTRGGKSFCCEWVVGREEVRHTAKMC
jgi:hypothetical protein